ncbi:putative quinol monooxygenase [Devosia sp.]|uniref:putative quinol monooxygenase n=1 Tax=Devosia sp. TaxID=1871048 RepID=UPI002FC68809
MGKVHLSGYLEVPADRIDAVRVALPHHIALTRAEPGCLAFTVVQNPAIPTRFDVSETFVDQAAFDQHQQRAQASDWARVTLDMPRHFTIRVEDGSWPA